MTNTLRPLNETKQQVILNDMFQQGDIVEWVLEQLTGSVQILQTSFSIADEYLRRMFLIREKHNVERIEIILDHKATQKTLLIWELLRNVADAVYLCANHSKCILISDGKTNVTIITSQNLTRGNRNESTLISTDTDIYSSLYAQILDMKERLSLSLIDLINGSSNTPKSGKSDNE